MPLLNPYLRAFFRSALPAQCTPVQDYILLVPTTEILASTRDRETGSLYSDLAGSDEFLGSHVLRVPNVTAGAQNVGGRESRGKARQFTTFNGRTVIVKDSWIYSNKGFRNLNQAQLLNDMLFYPDVSEPEQWLIYFISKPLIGSLEYVSTIPPYLRDRTKPDVPTPPIGSSHRAAKKKKEVKTFNELLMLFPMIARQMQAGLEAMFNDFEVSFERFKPLPIRPPSPASTRSGASGSSSRASVHSSINGDVYKQAADESEIRRSLEAAITTAIDLFQRVDQSQLDLLASTTDLTGPAVDRLIERYVSEQLHDTTLFPRLCATKAIEDEELEHKIREMENVDITQVGIPQIDHQDKKRLGKRIARGIESFGKIGTAKSPQSMVEHLLQTARTMTKSDEVEAEVLETSSAAEKAAAPVVTMNADMLVSLLLIVVIRSKVPHLHACLSYMRNFVFAEDMEQGEIGYVLSTLEAVLFHIAQDHVLVAASRANEKLWRAVKQGKIKAVGTILETNRKDENLEELLNGDSAKREPSISSSLESQEPMTNGIGADATHSIVPGSGSTGVALTNGVLSDRTIASGKGSQHSAKDGVNGGVHISDAPPISIPTDEVADDEGKPDALGSEEEGSKTDGEALVKDRPPAEDEFDTPTSSSTGVACIRIEELRTGGDTDADSISSVQIDTTPFPHKQVTTANARIGIARFDVRDKPSSLKFRRNKSSTSFASFVSVATIGDASIASTSVIKSDASQNPTVDAFSVEKLSKTRNRLGESILMMAIQERKADMLQYLLDSPLFDVNYILDDARDDGTTLLSAAVQMEDMPCVEVLLKAVAKLSDKTLRRYLQKPDVNGRTVAHYLFSTPDLISRLGRWLPWRAKDKNGQTPLFALCRSYDHQRYKEMVTAAIKQAQASQLDHARLHLDEHIDSKGNTLLHIAAHHAVVRLLLKCDSDVNATNDKGFTPLMVASKYGRTEMIRTIFGDYRVNLLAKELRGLTAVELAKDDDVKNRIDDLVLFQNAPADDGRVTAVVRSFFVEDASIRVVLKSGAPSADSSTFTITTCRRSLTDFQFLAKWLQYENPASWLPNLLVSRSPYQIPSKPSRAVLRDIQLRVDSFLRTLLLHPTFSTHELLWEFFLVPEMQQESLIDRSKKKAEARIERVREEFIPVEDVREVEMFVSFAKDSVRSINIACRSVTRRATAYRMTISDLPDTFRNVIRHLNDFKFLHDTVQITALKRFTETLILNESHPYTLFLEDLRNILASLSGVTIALERPKYIITQINGIQKQIDRHLISLRRSDRWPLGLLDDTRAKYHQEAAQKAQERHKERTHLACELRYTQSVAAQELAAFHDMHTKQARIAIRELARRQVVVEKDRLERMKRALRVLRT